MEHSEYDLDAHEISASGGNGSVVRSWLLELFMRHSDRTARSSRTSHPTSRLG